MSEPAPPQLRLSSPADLVEAVPYLLGFHPRDSLVALALRGPRRRLALTLRIDLPEPAQEPAEVAVTVAGYLSRAGAQHAALVVFGEAAAGGAGLPHRELVDAVARAVGRRGIGLTEAVFCGSGRWWSYICPDPACCPADGTPTAGGRSRVAAAATYAGLVALPSREALEQGLEPVGSGMRAALDSAARTAAVCRRRPRDRAALQAESQRLLAAAVDDEPALTDDSAARLIVGLGDIDVRDACCAWAHTPRSAAARRLWTQLARRAAPPDDAVPWGLLGWFAYLDGDATLAGMAVVRCLRSDSGHRLGLLLRDALDRGLDPARLRPVGSSRPGRAGQPASTKTSDATS